MKSLQTCTPGMFAQATDGELFARMMRRDDESKEAWAELFRRYIEDLHRRVCKIRGLSRANVSDLVQDTMLQAYAAAHTYKSDATLDPAAARFRTLAWLLRIAHNCYRTKWRTQTDVKTDGFAVQDSDGETFPSSKKQQGIISGKLYREVRDAEDRVAGAEGQESTSRRRRLLREALETLSECERDIITAKYEHYDRGKPRRPLPRPVIKQICARHNINSTYLRKLRERAEDKIKKYVEDQLSAGS